MSAMLFLSVAVMGASVGQEVETFFRCLIEPGQHSRPELEAEGIGIYLPSGVIEGASSGAEFKDPNGLFSDVGRLQLGKKSNGEIAFINMNTKPAEVLVLYPTTAPESYKAAYSKDDNLPRLGTCGMTVGAKAKSIRDYLQTRPEKLDLVR